MATPFRLGLAGAGRMGTTHLQALQRSSLVTVAAVAEPDPTARDAVARTYDVGVHERLDAMLDGADLDGVLVAAPTEQHEAIIRELSARGLPILCEKPCGMDSDQLRGASAAAESAGVPLQVAYWRRHVPALQALRQRIALGELGELQLVACHQWDERPPAAAFRNRSGGILIDMGVHEFDQLRWLTGQDVDELQVLAADGVSDPEVTADVDTAQVTARLSRGACGLVALGRHFPGGDCVRVEVYGRDDAVQLQVVGPGGVDVQLAAICRQAEAFRAHVRGEATSGATVADALAALALAERATQALEQAMAR